MKNNILLIVLLGFLGLSATAQETKSTAKVWAKIVVPESPRDVPQPVDGAPLTAEYVKAIGQIAYIWAWPMMNMEGRLNLFSTVDHSVLYGGALPVGPIGHVTMLHSYIKPNQRFVTCPNQDVVYGAGFFDLDKEPVIIQVPDFGDRFWVYQVVDQRTDSYCEMGKQYGTKPGFYLLVGPKWNGKKPKGVTDVFHSSTSLSAAFPRIFLDDTKQDNKAVQPLINQVMAYPLKEYDGKMKTTVWADLPIMEKKSGGSSETQWVNPENFADLLPVILTKVKPLPGEEALYAWMWSIVNATKNNPKLKQALIDVAKTTEKEIISDMFELRNNGVEAGNGWRTQKNAAQFGTGYFQRTATAKGNMFSNRGIETMYFGNDFDSNGNRLNGSNTYTITFAKGQTPPVDGFWSLTLYNESHFFVPNELNRFSLGTKNKNLVYNKDGSLTIYVQPNNPGKIKENNWLPSPNSENFSLYIRSYWPKESILNSSWTPPTIKVVK